VSSFLDLWELSLAVGGFSHICLVLELFQTETCHFNSCSSAHCRLLCSHLIPMRFQSSSSALYVSMFLFISCRSGYEKQRQSFLRSDVAVDVCDNFGTVTNCDLVSQFAIATGNFGAREAAVSVAARGSSCRRCHAHVGRDGNWKAMAGNSRNFRNRP
jgi:hypothetical protein